MNYIGLLIVWLTVQHPAGPKVEIQTIAFPDLIACQSQLTAVLHHEGVKDAQCIVLFDHS